MEEQGDNNGIIKDERKGFAKVTKEYVILILMCIAIAFALKSFVIERADVNGNSMKPTLHNSDVVIVEKISCLIKKYTSGEVIIFNSHDEDNEIYIKRVIATGGQTVEILKDQVYVNGSKLKEKYLAKGTLTKEGDFLSENQKYTVPKGYVFVMGDNRGDSMDSRIIGPVKIKDIEGHVILRVFPLARIRTF